MKELPCKECGGKCCNPPAMNKDDARKIMRYTQLKVEELKPNFWMLEGSWDEAGNMLQFCPAFNKEEKICNIYKFRPTVCKKYAVEKTLPCSYYISLEKQSISHQKDFKNMLIE
jgi:Fe-S-cluster containining protein